MYKHDPRVLTIGPYSLTNCLILAPMAGVTDRPFRQLCRSYGAGLAVSEMTASAPQLRNSLKSQQRRDHQQEPEPRSVQIVGADPQQMAEAARYQVDQGAQIIDINMGCPAKKVCQVAAGSALLRDEKLVAAILKAVVSAVTVPVTLKIRTGWSPTERNGVTIAKIAQDQGIQLLTVHGRTRACAYQGSAEYDTLALIKQAIAIPVIANGDIDSGEKARWVLAHTQADGVMIGRAAQGKPWIFQQIQHYLQHRVELPDPSPATQQTILLAHVTQLHEFYGNTLGVKVARKHISWYCKANPQRLPLWTAINALDDAQQQVACLQAHFDSEISNGA